MNIALCLIGRHDWKNVGIRRGKVIHIRKRCQRCGDMGPVLWTETPTEYRKLTAPDSRAFLAAEAKRIRKSEKRKASV